MNLNTLKCHPKYKTYQPYRYTTADRATGKLNTTTAFKDGHFYNLLKNWMQIVLNTINHKSIRTDDINKKRNKLSEMLY